MGKALSGAMARAGLKPADIAKAMEVSHATVTNWAKGASGIHPLMAAKLGVLLAVPPDTLASPIKHSGPNTRPKKTPKKKQPRGRPRKTPPADAAQGPAQRAAALHAARERRTALVPVPAPARTPRAPAAGRDGVFGMEARADGTMALWLRATLPMEPGVRLLKLLLDLDLVQSTGLADE
jgi:transcriptional regulator with XRE-family HTH domain